LIKRESISLRDVGSKPKHHRKYSSPLESITGGKGKYIENLLQNGSVLPNLYNNTPEQPKTPAKKRIRNRPKRPRKLPDFSDQVGPGQEPRNVLWLRLFWRREGEFKREAYESMKKYLLERNCAVFERPQQRNNPDGPDRVLYVRMHDRPRYHNAVKKQVERFGQGMRTEQVSDPFASPFLNRSSRREETLKGG
jgi:hypothetical protein